MKGKQFFPPSEVELAFWRIIGHSYDLDEVRALKVWADEMERLHAAHLGLKQVEPGRA